MSSRGRRSYLLSASLVRRDRRHRSWEVAKKTADEIKEQGGLSNAYVLFADCLEQGVLDLTGFDSEDLRQKGTRSQAPKVINISAFDACPGQPVSNTTGRLLRKLQTLLANDALDFSLGDAVSAENGLNKLLRYTPPAVKPPEW